MRIEALLPSPDHVLAQLKAGSKKQTLQELARRACDLTGLHERAIFDVLLERERLGSTGIGAGIALPHGRLADLAAPFGLFAKLDQPVEFAAIDEQPVDLVFLLLTREGAGADHLQALARVSRLLRDRQVCEKVRGADKPEAIFALLTDPAHSHAA